MASSSQAGFAAELAVDEDVRTFWAAETGNKGEWLQVDLGEASEVHALQVNYSDHDCSQLGREGDRLYHRYVIEGSMNGRDWKALVDKSESNEDAPNGFQVLDAAATVRFVRITNIHPPANGVFSLSGLRVFGLQDKPKPAAIENCQVKRSEDDPRFVDLRWDADPAATGYLVRWGIAADKLYLSTIVYDQNQLTIRSLHRDKEYFFRIDAFNEAGVTEGG